MAPIIRTRPALTRDRRAFGAFDPGLTGDLRRRELIDAAIAARRCWVAELDARIVAYSAISNSFFGRDFIELVYVAADARRMGAGGAILAAMERFCKAERVFISANESNAPMRALLARRDYKATGRIDNLDPGDPELIFVKFLGD